MVWPFKKRRYATWGDVPSFEETLHPGYDDLIRTPLMPEVTPPKLDGVNPCNFTVGLTTSGLTVLRLETDDGSTSMTLTMSSDRTKALIKLLQSTVDDSNE